MKTCWDLLGIEKTGDLPAIQRARRSLIKQWHPDSVADPAEKRERTNRCVEINKAFDEAVRIAKVFQPIAHSTNPEHPVVVDPGSLQFNFTLGGRNQCLAAMGLVLLFTFQSFVYLFIGLTALAVLAIGLGIVAVLDILFVTVILKPALGLASLVGPAVRKHEKTVTWLALLLLNILAVKFWPSGTGLTVFGAAGGRILRVSIACSISVWLFFMWFREDLFRPSARPANL